MPSRSLTAAVWTPSGRGAVATIRVRGDLATLSEGIAGFFQAASGRSLAETPQQRISFGRWGCDEKPEHSRHRACLGGSRDSALPASGSLPESSSSAEAREPPRQAGRRETETFAASEDVIVCLTGPDACEIHCHGGDAAVRRILSDLQSLGCEIVDWQSQLESERGIWEREHSDALSHATTLRAAGWIAAQAGRMEQAMAELTALVADGQREQAAVRANEILAGANFGLHLTQPWEVVLAGRPNVGKSSLINALVGFERSIVFDEPGTTRDVVTAETALDGWAIRLSDTAGQRGSSTELEAAGIARAREAFASADARLLLIDISEPPQDDDRNLLAEWPDALTVAHKADLPDAWGESLPRNAIRVSSLQRTGLVELSLAIVSRLIPELPTDQTVIPLTERHLNELHAFEIF